MGQNNKTGHGNNYEVGEDPMKVFMQEFVNHDKRCKEIEGIEEISKVARQNPQKSPRLSIKIHVRREKFF